MEVRFDDQVAVLTGSTRGIRHAIANVIEERCARNDPGPLTDAQIAAFARR